MTTISRYYHGEMKNCPFREMRFAPGHRDFWETRFWENYLTCEKCQKCCKINGFDDLLFSDFPKKEIPKNVFGDFQTFLGTFLGKQSYQKLGGASCERKVIREDVKNAH